MGKALSSDLFSSWTGLVAITMLSESSNIVLYRNCVMYVAVYRKQDGWMTFKVLLIIFP